MLFICCFHSSRGVLHGAGARAGRFCGADTLPVGCTRVRRRLPAHLVHPWSSLRPFLRLCVAFPRLYRISRDVHSGPSHPATCIYRLDRKSMIYAMYHRPLARRSHAHNHTVQSSPHNHQPVEHACADGQRLAVAIMHVSMCRLCTYVQTVLCTKSLRTFQALQTAASGIDCRSS